MTHTLTFYCSTCDAYRRVPDAVCSRVECGHSQACEHRRSCLECEHAGQPRPQHHEKVSRTELIATYCARQEATPDDVEARLRKIEGEREVAGWMLLECQMLDSSRCGEYTLLPYGPGCTFKAPPFTPLSPRGLASDMSLVVKVSPRET